MNKSVSSYIQHLHPKGDFFSDSSYAVMNYVIIGLDSNG